MISGLLKDKEEGNNETGTIEREKDSWIKDKGVTIVAFYEIHG